MGQSAADQASAAEEEQDPTAEEQDLSSEESDVKRMTTRRRHIYLRGHFRWNDIRCQPPYNETPIAFSEDLLWVARKRKWRVVRLPSTGGPLARFKRAISSWWRREPVHGQPPILSGAVFDTVDLSGFDLSGADLRGATF
ncbi:MAG TPA: pentapeptide repeat-containing protein, partial [Ktedonobacterales bacterium]|nr:pentapeptide repeat-containing protein [Ktedonobacterales bacterium]